MPNTTLHAVVLISLYPAPQAPVHDGIAGIGVIAGLARGVCIVLMPGDYRSPWSGRQFGGVSGLGLDGVILGLSLLTAGIAHSGFIASVMADLGYSLVWFF